MAVAIENLPQDKVTFKLLGTYGNGRGDWGVQGFGIPPQLGTEVTISKRDGGSSTGTILELVDVTPLNGGDYHWTARLAPVAKRYANGKRPGARRNYRRVQYDAPVRTIREDADPDRICLASTPVAEVYSL